MEKTTATRRKRLTIVGFFLTGAWALAFARVLYVNSGDLGAMSLNEWGDFLAGAFAPLAFFWLVVGYFQQGEELHLNTKALHAQQEELHQQVKETALLAKAAGEQAQAAQADLEYRQRREAMAAAPLFVSRECVLWATRGDSRDQKSRCRGTLGQGSLA